MSQYGKRPETMGPDKQKARKEIAAGLVVFRRTGEEPKFLLLYHRGAYWNIPKGKIEGARSGAGGAPAERETSLRAAIRETTEETGLRPSDLRIISGFKAHEKFFFKRGGRPTFKIVIVYLAETGREDIRISPEHSGFGWFLYPDARHILGRYKDSQKVLKQAYDFLRKRRRPRGSGKRPASGERGATEMVPDGFSGNMYLSRN